MRHQTYQFRCICFLFSLFGICYNLIELIWRKRTHWSMFFLGGACGLWICRCAKSSAQRKKLRGFVHPILGRAKTAVRCGIGITAREFLCGLIVNKMLHMDVWDYSRCRFQLLGQICLSYFAAWCGLSYLALMIMERIKRCKG